MIRYYVISYLWQTPKHDRPSFGTGLIRTDEGITGVYEHIIGQPEKWCLTHVAEITREEYEKAKTRGIIG